jgi:hypothetical protein
MEIKKSRLAKSYDYELDDDFEIFIPSAYAKSKNVDTSYVVTIGSDSETDDENC